MSEGMARIVQLSDTHLSAAEGLPSSWSALAAWLRADPPDLVVHTGDIVLEDPDDATDRAFARLALDRLGVAYVAIPGNHDVGFYDTPEELPRRVESFRRTWGHDTFCVDLGGWRLVGADVYRAGEEQHDAWLGEVTHVASPVLVFLHQALSGEPCDGWEMPPSAAVALDAALAGADVRAVAVGHRHCAAEYVDARGRRVVWAPSTRFTGDAGHPPAGATGVDPRPGVLEHRVTAAGGHTVIRHQPLRHG